jgi:hypothetical protein
MFCCARQGMGVITEASTKRRQLEVIDMAA